MVLNLQEALLPRCYHGVNGNFAVDSVPAPYINNDAVVTRCFTGSISSTESARLWDGSELRRMQCVYLACRWNNAIVTTLQRGNENRRTLRRPTPEAKPLPCRCVPTMVNRDAGASPDAFPRGSVGTIRLHYCCAR